MGCIIPSTTASRPIPRNTSPRCSSKAAYAPDAACPLFLRYLESMLAEEEIFLIQEIMGCLRLPVNKAQKSFVFVGALNAGKSTLLNVVQEILLGSENVLNIPWQNLSDRFNRVELFDKLANIFADLPSKSIDDNGMFKALTGEDFITAERKNKDPFSFRPYARFLFSCNEIPRNYGDRSEGFYRRLLIIRFEKSVPKAKRDPNLAEKLAAERDGILMWALTGLKRLIASGYVFSETERTRAELEKYRIESNSVLSFAKLYCVAEKEGVAVRDDLFLRYKEYCGNAGMKPVSQTNFNKELEAGFPEITRGRDICGNKTRKMIRKDTELRNFPLYCPKCKKETIINAQDMEATVDKGIHYKFTKTELPTLYKVPPKRDYGRYFYILAEKGGTTPPGPDVKVGPLFSCPKSGGKCIPDVRYFNSIVTFSDFKGNAKCV